MAQHLKKAVILHTFGVQVLGSESHSTAPSRGSAREAMTLAFGFGRGLRSWA